MSTFSLYFHEEHLVFMSGNGNKRSLIYVRRDVRGSPDITTVDNEGHLVGANLNPAECWKNMYDACVNEGNYVISHSSDVGIFCIEVDGDSVFVSSVVDGKNQSYHYGSIRECYPAELFKDAFLKASQYQF
jgi:hypothetical protein